MAGFLSADRLKDRQNILEAAESLAHSIAPPLLTFDALAMDLHPLRLGLSRLVLRIFGEIRPDLAMLLFSRNNGTTRGSKRVEAAHLRTCLRIRRGSEAGAVRAWNRIRGAGGARRAEAARARDRVCRARGSRGKCAWGSRQVPRGRRPAESAAAATLAAARSCTADVSATSANIRCGTCVELRGRRLEPYGIRWTW